MNRFKKILKKTLKWTGITLLVLIILLILVPIIFKDQLKQLVIDEVNKSLLAELSLRDFDLTFISTFPNMTIELMDAKLQGKDQFKDVTLADIKSIKAHVGFWSVVSGDQVEIDEIHISDPIFNVKVLEDGLANYDIVKPDSLKTPEEIEEPSSFKLSLKEYSISNATLIYDDRESPMYAEMRNLTHTGTGDLTADVIDFETTTTMDQLSYKMGSVPYLTDVKTEAVINLLMEFTETTSKFTLKENEFKLNEVTFSIDGFYEMLENYSNMDLKLNASKATFKEFLSLIPVFYHSGYESMMTSGKLAINGEVKGKMDDINLPGWDFRMLVSNASIKYPDLPGKISNIQVDAGSKFVGGENLDLMTVDVPKFHANLSKNTIDANLSLRRIMSDPFIKSRILANFDLATLKDYVPLTEEESYNGTLEADVDIEGKMSDLEKEDFEKFTAKGHIILADILYKSPDLPDAVDINKAKFSFSPQNLSLDELNAKMGKSDFAMDGKVDNYFGYLLRDELLKGNFNLNSNYLDLDALMPASTEGEAPTESEATASSEEPLLVPGNVDFNLATNINKTRYNGIDISNLRGNVRIKDEVASLDNLTMNAMGGTVGLKGKYNTQNHDKPKMDFGYSLGDINIQDLSKNFLTVGKLAPIMKYAHGKISSDFNMTTDLTPSFEPILASLSSIGDLRSNSISIKGFELLEKMETVTKLKNLSNQTITNFKTKFKVEDGKVSVTPFDVKLGKINSEVSGYTTLDQQMDYKIKMNVPKDQIPAEMIKQVEAAMSQLNALVPTLNIGKLPDVIPVNVKMIGDVKNPKITTDFKEAILKATGDFKDNLVEGIKDAVKDTVTAVIKDVIEDTKAEIEKQKQKILNDAQKEANKVIAEAKKAADVVRAEGDKQAEALIKEAGSNPLKKKLAEEAAKKVRATAETNAKKLEDEGKKKSDGIMSRARAEADKLG